MTRTREWAAAFILAAGTHALAVSAAVGAAFLAVHGSSDAPIPAGRVSDVAILVLCLPLQPILASGPTEWFFLLLPLNTALYGFALAWPLWWTLRAVRRRRGSRRGIGA